MQLKVEEISELIKQKIEGFNLDFNKEETVSSYPWGTALPSSTAWRMPCRMS